MKKNKRDDNLTNNAAGQDGADIDAVTDETAAPDAREPNPDAAEPETAGDVEIIENKPDDEITALKKQCAEYLDKLQRTLADFDNFRKRTIKEKTGMYDDGVRETIEKLLPIIDNFERAVASAAQDNKNDSFFKGISLIQRQLAGYLDDIGIEPAGEIGEKFDPLKHFAVTHAEDGNFGPNEIAEVLQKGYIYKDKVIRAGMVKVAN